ncbi:hypothetical protein RJT34_18411 [Clitoria ternatea]|uniref:Protein kinase domain-containing protein n=1 Tax=Clitoria ternatea TaxID=43366 RepID=A0AAN9PFT1_CLITE
MGRFLSLVFLAALVTALRNTIIIAAEDLTSPKNITDGGGCVGLHCLVADDPLANLMVDPYGLGAMLLPLDNFVSGDTPDPNKNVKSACKYRDASSNNIWRVRGSPQGGVSGTFRQVLDHGIVYSYDPPDNFAVKCGHTGNITLENRIWVGDVDSKLFSIIEPQTGQGQPSVVVADAPTYPPVDHDLFGSARLSHSEFTYSFPLVTNGPKIIRLHFYPTSFGGNFEPNNSIFSVKVGNFTLLKNNNPSRYVVKNSQTISGEYCINVESGEWLNISFLPSTSHSDAYYAFINAIEVVSTPPFLYYSNPDGSGFKFVDHPGTFHKLLNNKALELFYRVNVGDITVPPGSDTGMFRNWDVDYPKFLRKQYPNSVSSNYTHEPIYKDNVAPNYTAPKDVYLTARSYGKDATEDYNVTWEFRVDSEFLYMVSNNLAGPNPEPLPRLSPPQQALLQNQSSKSSKTAIIIIAVVVVSCLVLASVIGIKVFWRRRRAPDTEESSCKTKRTEGSTLPSQLCRYFTITELRAATNNFDDVFIIGVGGFGNVYKGYIDDATPVAIKRLKPGSQQGVDEFLNEIGMLSQLRHIHLVSLIGYCNDGAEMILVYDFMQRGTLREYLYGCDNPPLSWKQRLEILLGAARGLQYLHAGAKHNIIHRDVKSTNILLDEKWVAKVSDFGLSKVGPTGTSTTHVSTVVKGSLGYLDPEYYKRQRLTLKSDVYSFGVVLLEVLCARPPLVRTLDKPKVSLADWFRRCNERGEILQMLDPYLRDSISGESLRSYCQLALSCLHDDGNQRPSMSDVVGALEFATQLVENAQDNKFDGTQVEKKSEEKPLLLPIHFVSDEGSTDVRFSSTDDSGSRVTTTSGSSEEQTLVPANVFSEIGNPRAR